MNHAALITSPTAGAHHLFQVYGQNDSYAPPITEVTYAIAAGLARKATQITKLDFQPCPGCTQSFRRKSQERRLGNVANLFTAAVRQYAQPADADAQPTYDGHFVAYHNPLAQHDIYRFLDDIANRRVPTVGP